MTTTWIGIVLLGALTTVGCGELRIPPEDPPSAPDEEGETLPEMMAGEAEEPEVEDSGAAAPSGPRVVAVVDTRGGVVRGAGGVSVSVPPGAVAEPTEITIEAITTDDTLAAIAEGGVTFRPLGTTYRLGPEGMVFAVPVTVSLPFDESLVPSELRGLQDLQVFTAPTGDGPFTSLGGWVTGEGTVRATTPHFSVFVVGSESFTALARRETYPSGLATDDRQVFWVSGGSDTWAIRADGGVVRRPDGGVDGGADGEVPRGEQSIVMTLRLPEAISDGGDGLATLEAGVPTPLLPAVEDGRQLAVDRGWLYATVGGHPAPDGGPTGAALVRRPKTAGALTVLTRAVRFPTALALATDDAGAATQVYVSDWDTGRVLKIPPTGGTPAVVATGQGQVPFLVVAGGYVYWTAPDLGQVRRVPIPGGAVQTVASGLARPWGLAVEGTTLYVTSRGAGLGDGALVRIDGPQVDVLWDHLGQPEQLARVGDWLTFPDTGLRGLLQLHKGTGHRRSRALGQAVPNQVLVSGGQVFWTNAGDDERKGAVHRMPLARCTVDECAAQGLFCSTSTGSCTATCPTAPTHPRDVYVNPQVPAGGTGTAACPVRTTTQALEVLGASLATGQKSAYLAPGRYDVTTGETFPWVARGLRIVGAGAGLTRVVGSGPSPARATVVTGSPTTASYVGKLTIQPTPGAVPGAGVGTGVLCDQGPGGTSLADGGAPPWTVVEGLVVGPAYEVGVTATARVGSSGEACTLRLVGSTLERNGVGLRAGAPTPSATADGTVAVEIGDGTVARANRFVRSYTNDVTGVGVEILSGTRTALVRTNRFDGDDVAMVVRRDGPRSDTSAEVVRLQGNTVVGPFVAGVWVRRGGVVDLLASNEVRGARYPGWLLGQGVGLLLDAETVPAPTVPRVVKARQNRIVGNDVGIRLRGPRAPLALAACDFGVVGDPGRNTLRCNGTPDDRVDLLGGADLWCDGVLPAGLTLPWAGNVWDHAVPASASSSSLAPRGVDVLAHGTVLAALDVGAGTSPPFTCPGGRTDGPPP